MTTIGAVLFIYITIACVAQPVIWIMIVTNTYSHAYTAKQLAKMSLILFVLTLITAVICDILSPGDFK